jgi:dienelactone hydrolase
MMLALAGVATAGVKAETMEYRDGETVCKGWLAMPEGAAGKLPGVLVVHEWWGLNDHAKRRAERLAAAGYIALAVDMYGMGQCAKDAEEAGKLAKALRDDRPKLRARAGAALAALKAHAAVDAEKLGAIGYCFGGTTVLEMARAGMEVRFVASFHGGLGSPVPAGKGQVKARVLVCHGADDPYVKAEEVGKFEEEMRRAGADWQVITYGGAVHSFTNEAAGSDPSKGVAYDAKADARSWEALMSFARECFGS